MSGELLLYALVAGGLVFWLRSILGTRHGEERDRSEGVISIGNETPATDMAMNLDASETNSEDQIQELLNKEDGPVSIANKDAQAGLLEIAAVDKSFDVKFFCEAVQDVFAMVVEGFGDGDKEMLQDLLADDVYKAFEGAIDARASSGETLANEIQAINKVEIIESKLNGKKADITVRFVASEISVTRDADGEIIAGHPDKATEMLDIWTFSRDIKSRDPRWFVIETRGDFDGDNETIPNSN